MRRPRKPRASAERPLELRLLADMLRIRRMEEKCAEPTVPAGSAVSRTSTSARKPAPPARCTRSPPTITSSPPTASTATRCCAVWAWTRSWPRCSARRRLLLARARRLDASVRRGAPLHGGNAIVGGGLPLAVAWRWRTGCKACAASPCACSAKARWPKAPSTSRSTRPALWQLPVLFCCENNLYAMGTALARSESQIPDLCAKAASYRVATFRADGMDVRAVFETREPRGAAGGGGGPAFVSCRPTLRAFDVRSRSVPRQGGDRGVEAARPHPQPLRAAEGRITRLDEEASSRSMPRPKPRWRRGRVRRTGAMGTGGGSAEGRAHAGRRGRRGRQRMSYREALRLALREALQNDARVFLMGEGRRPLRRQSYAVSKGLLEEFGSERIRDTPPVRTRPSAPAWGGARRPASDRRGDDGQFQPAGAGPDRQQRRRAAPHVRRPVPGAAGAAHGHRRRRQPARPALAQPGELVRPHSRHPRAGAGHRGRRARACSRRRSPTPIRW